MGFLIKSVACEKKVHIIQVIAASKTLITILGSVKSPFVCQECNKPFGTGRKLRDHIQVFHVKTRPHKCREGVCDKSFTTVNMRKRHERQVHKLNLYTPSGTKSKFTVEPPAAIELMNSSLNTAN